jgi:hypothetical protein
MPWDPLTLPELHPRCTHFHWTVDTLGPLTL